MTITRRPLVVVAAVVAVLVAACTTGGSADVGDAASSSTSMTSTLVQEAIEPLGLTATAAPTTLGPDVTFYEDVR